MEHLHNAVLTIIKLFVFVKQVGGEGFIVFEYFKGCSDSLTHIQISIQIPNKNRVKCLTLEYCKILTILEYMIKKKPPQ